MTAKQTLLSLSRLVGTWTTQASHPALPGVEVHGLAVFEWLQGEQFLIQRTSNDHPDFPGAISIIGYTDQDRVEPSTHALAQPAAESQLSMHYFDSRGVFRLCSARIDDTAWRIERIAPGFSQRFVGTFGEDGRRILGQWQLARDDAQWVDDLKISYRRK